MTTENKKRNLYLGITIPIVVAVATFLGFMFAPGSFLIHPEFKISVTETPSSLTAEFVDETNSKSKISEPGTSLEIPSGLNPDDLEFVYTEKSFVFSFQNTGWVQAKDVKIYVASTNGFHEQDSHCPELNTNIKQTSEIIQTTTISLDRMSVNLPCDLHFSIPDDSQINQIVVTADNSPSAVWNFKTEETEQVESPIFEILNTIVATVISISTALGIHTITKKKKRK